MDQVIKKLKSLNLSLIEKCLLTICSILVFVFLTKLKVIFVPLLSALMLYLIFSPLQFKLLDRWKWNRKVSSTFTLILSYSSLYIVLLSLAYVGSKLGVLLDKNEESIKSIASSIDFNFMSYSFGLSDIDSSMIFSSLKSFSGGALEFLSFTVLVHVFLFFMFFSNNQRKRLNSYTNLSDKVSSYIWVKLLLAFITACIAGLVFSLVGLQLTLSLVILIFIFDLLPNIGAFLSILIPLPVAYFQFGTSAEFFIVATTTAVVQFVVGNFIEPKMIGKKVGVSPTLVVCSMIFWGLVWGPAGVFLAIPISIFIKLFITENLQKA